MAANKVEIIAQGARLKDTQADLRSADLRAFAMAVLEALGKERWKMTLVFCGDEFIKRLNHDFRGKDEPTDVLSFAGGETRRGYFYAGDIIISLETLARNADKFSVGIEEELRRLIVHGILHLAGMNHRTNNADEPMLALQEQLLKQTLKEIAWE